MKAGMTSLFLAVWVSAVPCAASPPAPSLWYGIDLNRRADDLFHVTLQVSGLRSENAIYQFAATAPGTYQVMNIGRYVKRFEAFDGQGRRVPVAQVSVNQWRLSDPAQVRTIRYAVSETWDSPLDHPIYRMCGTSIERGPRAHQPARGHRLSRRAAGGAGAAAAGLSRGVEGGHGAQARPRRRFRGRQLRPARRFADPPRPAHPRTAHGDRGPDRAVHLLGTPTRSRRASCWAR